MLSTAAEGDNITWDIGTLEANNSNGEKLNIYAEGSGTEIIEPIIVEQPQILIDEEFADWENVPTFVEDSDDDYGNGVDFRKLWVTNDGNYLFIRIDYFDEFILQEDTSSVLFINTDNNTSTGSSEYNSGAEIKYNFGKHYGEIYQNNNWQTIYHNDLKYVSAPTVSSSSFEICIKLDNQINSQQIFPSDNIEIKVVNYLENLDVIPNDNNSLSYTIQRNNSGSYAEYSIARGNQSAIRLLSYNVVYDRIFEEIAKPNYQRILNAISPDIIVFQEIYDHTSEETAQQVEEYLPSGTGQTWYHSKIQPVNDNQNSKTDLVVVSRYPILNSYRIQGIKNESAGYDRSNAAFLLDLPNIDANLLLVAAHPPCCQSNNFRELEMQEIMSFIRDAKTEGGEIDIPQNTPIIIAGDMNMVGFSRQVDILLNGDLLDNSTYGEDFLPDWDNTPFADSKPLTTNFPGVFTWYDEGSSYSPGRLDYIIYSDYTLDVTNSYSLHTKSLSNPELAQHGLLMDDTYLASDHLPVVADFVFTDIVGVEDEITSTPSQFKLNQNYPNPFNPSTTIEYSIPNVVPDFNLSNVTLKVYDVLGKEVATLVNETQSAGNYRVTFDASSLPSGVYFYRLVGGSFSETRKFTLMK